MKRPFVKLTAIAVAISLTLTACSTNTNEQNTVLGAGTGALAGGLLGTLAKGAGSGWVIAAGVVVGGLIGGLIGHNADSTDNTNMSMAMEKNPVNESSDWQNDKTGVYYTIVPTSPTYAYRGNPYCRNYMAYGKLNGETTRSKGIACRMDNGSWQQVR